MYIIKYFTIIKEYFFLYPLYAVWSSVRYRPTISLDEDKTFHKFLLHFLFSFQKILSLFSECHYVLGN